MNPYKSRHRHRGQPRIELLLTLYDGAMTPLRHALDLLKRSEHEAAAPVLAHVRAVVSGMAAGVDVSYGEVARNFLRLYEFVIHSLGVGSIASVESSLQVLTTLREGLETIRDEALQLERSGQIPPIANERCVELTA